MKEESDHGKMCFHENTIIEMSFSFFPKDKNTLGLRSSPF